MEISFHRHPIRNQTGVQGGSILNLRCCRKSREREGSAAVAPVAPGSRSGQQIADSQDQEHHRSDKKYRTANPDRYERSRGHIYTDAFAMAMVAIAHVGTVLSNLHYEANPTA